MVLAAVVALPLCLLEVPIFPMMTFVEYTIEIFSWEVVTYDIYARVNLFSQNERSDHCATEAPSNHKQ